MIIDDKCSCFEHAACHANDDWATKGFIILQNQVNGSLGVSLVKSPEQMFVKISDCPVSPRAGDVSPVSTG